MGHWESEPQPQCLWGAGGVLSCPLGAHALDATHQKRMGYAQSTAEAELVEGFISQPATLAEFNHDEERQQRMDAQQVELDGMVRSSTSMFLEGQALPRGPVQAYMGILPHEAPQVRENPRHPNYRPVVATLFQHCGNAGYGVPLSLGRYDLRSLQARGMVNKDVSAVRVQPGITVVLYDQDNFSGRSLAVTRDEDCLIRRGFNDSTTSVVVQRSSPTVPPPQMAPPTQQVRGGSYASTCRGCTMAGGLLTCESCQTMNGSWGGLTSAASSCAGDISNNNGRLQCMG